MASVLKESQFYLHTHTFIRNRNRAVPDCLPSYSWYSFTDPEGMEGRVGPDGWLRSQTVYLPGSHPFTHPTTNRAQSSMYSNCVDRDQRVTATLTSTSLGLLNRADNRNR